MEGNRRHLVLTSGLHHTHTHRIHTRLKIKMSSKLSWSQCLLTTTEQWLGQKAVWHSYPEGHIGSFSDVFWQGFVYSMLALKSEAGDDLELLILLPPTLECRDYRCAWPCLMYVVLGLEPGSFVSAGQALHQLSCIPSVTLAICEKLISMVQQLRSSVFYPNELKTLRPHKNLLMGVHTALFIISKPWRQPEHPSVCKWINKLIHLDNSVIEH